MTHDTEAYAIAETIRTARAALDAAYDTYEQAIVDATDTMNEAVAEYNRILEDAKEKTEDAQVELRNQLDRLDAIAESLNAAMADELQAEPGDLNISADYTTD